jgi:hypothetical protein
MKSVQDVEPALIPDGQSAKSGEPRQRTLDNPAVVAQTLRAIDTPASYARRDAPAPRGPAAVVVVVSFVGVQLGWAFPRSSPALADRWHGIDQLLEHLTVVDVSGREAESERNAVRVHEHVALGSGPAAVSRVWAGALAPLFAGKDALSIEQRLQSIAFAAPSRSSKTR